MSKELGIQGLEVDLSGIGEDTLEEMVEFCSSKGVPPDVLVGLAVCSLLGELEAGRMVLEPCGPSGDAWSLFNAA